MMKTFNKNKFQFAKLILWLLTLFYVHASFAAQAQLLGGRVAVHPELTKLTFIFKGDIKFKTFTLPNPTRAIIDVADAKQMAELRSIFFDQGLVKDMRTGIRKGTNLRIVLDLKEPAKIRAFYVGPNETFHGKLIVELTPLDINHLVPKKRLIIHKEIKTPKKAPLKKANEINKPISKENVNTAKSEAVTAKGLSLEITKGKEAQEKIAAENPHPVVITVPVRRKPRNIEVVIDPGHGGKDPGATGPHGVHEKTVVLAISKVIVHDLNRVYGIHADLTRKGDYYLTLRQRLRIARRDKADLFIAIHADEYKNANVQGASVFALSQHGASSEAARWIAKRENESELGGINHFNANSQQVRSVLLDLSQTVTIAQSLQVGQVVIDSLKLVTPLHQPYVEQAAFVVLKSPDIPSLLIETGFISNPIEEKELSTPSYQVKIAGAIAQGVVNYFEMHPPRGTIFYDEQQHWLAEHSGKK